MIQKEKMSACHSDEWSQNTAQSDGQRAGLPGRSYRRAEAGGTWP